MKAELTKSLPYFEPQAFGDMEVAGQPALWLTFSWNQQGQKYNMYNAEFKDLVNKTIEATNTKLSKQSTYGVYIHAKDQLSFIKSLIDQNSIPTQSDKDKINIGIMAVKELESTDPDYCDLLCEIDFLFRKL